MRRTINLNSISAVTAGQRTTIRIVDSFAYLGFLLTLGGTTFTAAHLSLIRVFLNDKECFSMTGADLDVVNQYLNDPASSTDSTLWIPFAGSGLLNQADEESTAVHVGVPHDDGTIIQSIRIELDVAAGAVAPTLAARALVRDAVAGRAAYFPFVRNTNVDISSSGKKTIPDIVDIRSSREAYVTNVFFKTAQMTNLRVQRNSVDMFDRPVVENKRFQSNGVRKPQAGWYAFDTRENGYGSIFDTLPAGGVQSLNWEMTMAAAESVIAYVWTVGKLA